MRSIYSIQWWMSGSEKLNETCTNDAYGILVQSTTESDHINSLYFQNIHKRPVCGGIILNEKMDKVSLVENCTYSYTTCINYV